MAPLVRPACLLVLLVCAASAQPDPHGVVDDINKLKAAQAHGRPADAAPTVGAYSPDKVRAAHDAIQKAGLALSDLIDQSDGGMGWNTQNLVDFAPSLDAASKAIAALYMKYPSAVADAYGNGSMTNIEDTFKLFGGGRLERGCISHQATTFDAVSPLLAKSTMTVKKIRIGTVLQHNAVIVFPSGTDWKKTGVIYDAWLRQKSAPEKMTYLFRNWVSFGNRPRLLADDE